MTSLRNNVAGKDPSAGWEKSRRSAQPRRKEDRASCSGVKPDGAKTNSPAFAEDFMLEHSRSGVRMTLVVVPATTGAASQESQQSSVCFGFPS